MKEQKGMGHIGLIISIIIIILAIVAIVNFVNKKLADEKIENYQTDMLLVQGKIKVLAQESEIQKNEGVLNGRKVSDNLEDKKIKELLEKGIISQDEGQFSKYYILEKVNLEEIGLESINLENGYFIVNYYTYEVIYSEGVEIDGNVYYKLSEIQEKTNEDENNNEINSEKTKENTKK